MGFDEKFKESLRSNGNDETRRRLIIKEQSSRGPEEQIVKDSTKYKNTIRGSKYLF